MAEKTGSIQMLGPPPMGVAPQLSLAGGTNQQQNKNDTGIKFGDGTIRVEHSDGSVTIDFGGDDKDEGAPSDGFHQNLALKLNEAKLAEISSDLLEGIQRDEDSRKEWLATRTLGISLLGAKLEKPRTDTGLSGAPLEGMSTVRHPLMMGAAVNFQATARGNLLPASGPCKVRNDRPPPPVTDGNPTSAAQDISDSLDNTDVLGQALEKDMNHYLTTVATEYYPDTDRMLFYIGFGGDGFKKVYNCPLRRRPVSESVDAEDLIISNHATDLHSCGRITHRISMRHSILRRMQIMGAYRDVHISEPTAHKPNEVEKKKAEVEGVDPAYLRPKDRDHEILECYCELVLDEYAPKKFKGKELPLPYRVTLERQSREVLDVRRNWEEKDEQALAKRFFVQFPFIRGLGFYGLGFIHLIGNATNALTAAWREFLDAGMFNCFPGFIYAKGVGRQNTNTFRVPPGGGIGLDVGAQQSIKDAIMPLPYKEPGAATVSFVQHVEETAQRLAGTADIGVGEGKQDAPVGTTLALIEQASKVTDSAHKRLYASQAEELQLLKERFREDPEAFWRHNKTPTVQWKKDQFVQALNNYELVPVADPNNPTSLHRLAKAMAIKQLQQANPAIYDSQGVDMRIMRIADIDPSGLFAAQPAAPPPDPRMLAVNAKMQAEQMKNQIAQAELQIKLAESQQTFQDKEKERQSRERVEAMKLQLEQLRIKQEQVIHSHEIARDNAAAHNDMSMDWQKHMQDLQQQAQQHQLQMQTDQVQAEHELRGGMIKAEHEHKVKQLRENLQVQRDRDKHQFEAQRAEEQHRMKMQQQQEMHEQKMEQLAAEIRAAAKAKPKEYSRGGAVIDPVVEALRLLSLPRRVVRDKSGRIIGTAIEDGNTAPPGVVNEDGSITVEIN